MVWTSAGRCARTRACRFWCSPRAGLKATRSQPWTRAALRRVDGPSPSSEPIVRGGLVIDRERFRVLRDGEEVRLTPKEFELLTYLAQHPGRVLTHRVILKAIWGPHAAGQP